ncbi:spore coat protein GerQ [Rummeliibacillus sp. G93]|uniref:Spore coat protein GerQ n=1 Tax=Rummeliibacillus stabekisii TaxID=241244 RepID=A0A143HH98_9BACL|nr:MULTISPECIES: spore coat protein GerQ [Rummeliibacillus]AMX00847.1 spore coat protein GerQ [Rummeliibacillus stabekisii]MBB5170554.1 spore germination protein Q [Rummeliibacillus stabekisii]UQW97698.1 spore coat protein GerQ [Rummeliibacillus sp. G93]GEL04808.1 hypothetical protein RST01_14350 [Rummeliibacillus stabekisii]
MVQYYWTPNYQQQTYPAGGVTIPTGTVQTTPSQGPATGGLHLGREQSYIENIMRLNRSKPGTFHFSFEHATAQGQNVVIIRGVIEAAGRDHVILRDIKTNHRFLMPMIYFDYAEFDEPLQYFDQTP